MKLTDEQLTGLRRALLDANAQSFIDSIFRLKTHIPAENLAVARSLGLVDGSSLTPLGELVGDAIREYCLWIERGRAIHFETKHAGLSAASYAGKSVLEVGSGFGCNLFSMAAHDGMFVGVEPIEVYRQISPILAEREGIAPPRIVDGFGEQLPFEAGTFDIVVCYSAHQYMDIRKAFGEMARVLKPGGQVQIIAETLHSVLTGYYLGRIIHTRSLSSVKAYLLTIANTLAYQTTGHRVSQRHGVYTPPVHPGNRVLAKWLSAAGLSVRRDLFLQHGQQSCHFADKATG